MGQKGTLIVALHLNKEQTPGKKNPFKMFELARDLKKAAREVEFMVSPEFNEKCRGLNGGSVYLAERGLEPTYCQDMLKGVKMFLEERFMA